jgi:hypothetical protein
MSYEVQWPDYNHPKNCSVHVRNELVTAEEQEKVWAWLIRATLWPVWYENAANVRILEGAGPNLEKGVRFKWKTMGITVNCTVVEYVPNERIAWTGRAFGIDVYHAWVLIPLEQGCCVLTEETQRGLIARLAKSFISNGMYNAHQLWLEGLKAKAHSGLPPVA